MFHLRRNIVGATSWSRPGGRSYRRKFLHLTKTVEFLNETILNRIGIITLFCEIDDFYLLYIKYQEQHQLPEILGSRKIRGSPRCLHPSEVMTILVHFHQKQYKNLKAYYQDYVCCQLRWAFPKLVSYSRFVQLSQEVLVPLSIFLNTRFGECRGISFIDSTPLPVCHNRRISTHRVFAECAGRAKTSMGWFYGFKLHVVINDQGELLSAMVARGNVDDR